MPSDTGSPATPCAVATPTSSVYEFTCSTEAVKTGLAKRLIPSIGLERTVCDYVAGMTDRYAQDEIRRLFYPYEQLL